LHSIGINTKEIHILALEVTTDDEKVHTYDRKAMSKLIEHILKNNKGIKIKSSALEVMLSMIVI
jgi:hypothetical protein